MKNIRIILLLGIALLWACNPDESEFSPAGESVQVELTFGIKEYAGIVTRSVSIPEQPQDGLSFTYKQPRGGLLPPPQTRAGDDPIMTGGWVLQFGSNGRLLSRPVLFYAPTEITQSGLAFYKTAVTLVNDSNSTVYILANASTAFFSGWTEAEVRVYTIDVFKTDVIDLMSKNDAEDYLDRLLIGCYTGRVAPAAEMAVWVTRVGAEFDLTVDNQVSGLDLSEVQVRSVSSKTFIYDWEHYSNNVLFPKTDANNFFNYDPDLGDQGGAYPTNFSLSWSVPENIRGQAAGGLITNQKDKYYLNDPSYVSGQSLSTHIVLRGTYLDVIQDKLVLVSISLYPGLNNLSDFNIVRNTKYEMTATISQLDADDKRIEYNRNAFVTYIYYYHDWSLGYLPFAKYYDENVQTNDPIAPNADILNKYNSYARYNYYCYGDGFIDPLSGSATTVNADSRQNIVHVYYYDY